MTTYSQRQALGQQAQAWAKKVKFWLAIENAAVPPQMLIASTHAYVTTA